MRQFHEVRPGEHVQRFLLRLLHDFRAPFSQYQMRMVSDKASSRKYPSYRGKGVDTPLQIVSQALDSEREQHTQPRYNKAGVTGKMETAANSLASQF